MASETTTEMLRAAIETALRRRDPCADVCSGDAPNGFSGRDASASVMHGYAASRGDSDDEALRRLARLLGLRDDGSDPAEDVERLTRALHDAADRLGCADYDDVCAAVADALDDTEKREREHIDEANALRMERDRLQRACDEGLPRERIDCPACGDRHVEGPRHDNPAIDGRARPHHTHRCYHCGHVWDAKRWSFGVAEGEETTVAPSEVARLDDVAKSALDDLARVCAEIDAAHDLIAAQAALLTGVANALRGEPAPLASHSHHDLDLRAAGMKRELDAARSAAREHLAAADEHDKARRAPAQKGSYMRLVEAQDRLDAAREALRKITEEDGR